MIRLLRLISWPYFRKHILRTLLTTAGIVLGVAVFVGMHTANQSVLYAFNRTVDRIAGRTELQVTAGETGFDEEILERVQSARTVGVAVPVIEAVVESSVKGQGSLLVLGVDMTGDRSLRDYDLENGDESIVDDPLVFLAQPDSIILTNEFAARNHVGVNAQVTLGTALGERRFTVRGIMKSGGLTSAYGGNLAIMDLYAAQKMFGRGRRFDRIDLAVKPGHTIAECETELRALLGPGFTVDPPSGRGQHFEQMLSAYSMMVNISSVLALFIGMFIIYNAFAIAVTQRRSEIGILRALGATRPQIQMLFLAESAITGLVGSVAGFGAGLLMARGIAASIGTLVNDVYGVAGRADEIAANPAVAFGAIGLGIATSMAAAWLPSRQAATVDPVRALQKGRYQILSAGESRLRVFLSAVAIALSIAALAVPTNRPIFYIGYALTIVAALLLSPLLSLVLAKLLRPVLRRLRPVEGTLAADSLIQSPRRTSSSVAAVMLSLAIVVAFAGMARASYSSISDWVGQTLNPDLFVIPSQSIVTRTFRFPEAMGAEIRSEPGVARVQLVRDARIIFRDVPVMILAVDILDIASTIHRTPVSGDAKTMYQIAAGGRGVILSENFSALQRIGVGDTIEIPAPYGVLRLPVVGVIVDYSDQQGSIFLERSVYKQYWHDDTLNVIRVYVTPGYSIADVRQRILDRYAGVRQVFVLTNSELKAYILTITDQWFALTSVQIAVAVLVAILGIVNTLTVSITDRRRELGVLRAVGGLRGQIRGTIWMEALAIAALGLILGAALGAVNLYYVLKIVHRDIAGMNLDYQYPFFVMLEMVPTMLTAAFVGALWPAESAAHGSLVEALEYE